MRPTGCRLDISDVGYTVDWGVEKISIGKSYVMVVASTVSLDSVNLGEFSNTPNWDFQQKYPL